LREPTSYHSIINNSDIKLIFILEEGYLP